MRDKLDQICEFIINNDDINNLKLQKILFYAKKESVGIFKKPLFNDKFERCRYGPVLVKVYKKYKMNSDRVLKRTGRVEYPLISKKEKIILLKIIKKYKNYTALELSRLSNQDRLVVNTKINEIIKL